MMQSMIKHQLNFGLKVSGTKRRHTRATPRLQPRNPAGQSAPQRQR